MRCILCVIQFILNYNAVKCHQCLQLIYIEFYIIFFKRTARDLLFFNVIDYSTQFAICKSDY